jgi:hypothetical protein
MGGPQDKKYKKLRSKEGVVGRGLDGLTEARIAS